MKLLVLLLLLLAGTASAQTQTVVYLKNGSVIRGELQDSIPKIKIATIDGSLWVYERSEVLRIAEEVNPVFQNYWHGVGQATVTSSIIGDFHPGVEATYGWHYAGFLESMFGAGALTIGRSFALLGILDQKVLFNRDRFYLNTVVGFGEVIGSGSIPKPVTTVRVGLGSSLGVNHLRFSAGYSLIAVRASTGFTSLSIGYAF